MPLPLARSLPRTSVLSALAGLVLTAVLLTPSPDGPPLVATAAGAVPLALPITTTCADLLPPLRGTGPVVPSSDGTPIALPGGVTAEVRGGAVLAWESPDPVRGALVAGSERTHLYWYEPPVTRDAGLRAPDGPDGTAGAVRAVELCRAGRTEPDLAEVCIRAGHVPVAGPSTYADGRFDGALGPGFAVSVDPDDGTLAWRSDGVPISAVVTATSSPVLVEYDPPTTSGEDVPFLGVDGATGRVQLCGIVLASAVTPPRPASGG